METISSLDYFGYFAGILVLLAFLSPSKMWKYVLLLLGAWAFLIYGLLLKAYPIAVMSCLLMAIFFILIFKYRKKT